MINGQVSYHTFELHNEINKQAYYEYEKILRNYCTINKKRIFREDEKLICEAIKEKGIIIYLIKCEKKNSNQPYIYHGIWLRINPRRIINNDDYVGIFDVKDVDIMTKAITKLLRGIDSILPKFDEFIISRFDFCANINLGDQHLVEKYCELARRCSIPASMEIYKIYCNKAKRKIIPQNGFKLFNASVSFVVYNKKAQMESQKYEYPNGQSAEGLIRYEIQAKYRKIYNMRKKEKIETIYKFLSSGEILANKLFKQYMGMIYTTGNYHRYDIAEGIISKSNKSKKVKARMLELVRLSSEHKSLDAAIKVLYDNGELTDSNKNYLLNAFKELKLNPVTIPRRWNIESLPNPSVLINIKNLTILN